MTSLYQALRSGGPVETTDSRGGPITRWYYLDIEGALNDLASPEDVRFDPSPADRKYPVPGDRKQILDLTTQAAECQAGMFPLRIAFDPEAVNEWQRDLSVRSLTLGNWAAFQCAGAQDITDYRLPVIRLAKETPKEAVCTVFEKVNTGGVLTQRIRAAHRHVRG